MDCIFCKIISKEIPTKILYEDDDSISFLDAFPVAKGHTLVIPKKHFEKIQDMPSDLNKKLFASVHKMISKVDTIEGSTLVAVHNGKESGQEVPHVHVHLIPRSVTDSAGPVHSMFKNKIDLSDSEFDSLVNKLKIV